MMLTNVNRQRLLTKINISLAGLVGNKLFRLQQHGRLPGVQRGDSIQVEGKMDCKNIKRD